jgi:hypothetical protein
VALGARDLLGQALAEGTVVGQAGDHVGRRLGVERARSSALATAVAISSAYSCRRSAPWAGGSLATDERAHSATPVRIGAPAARSPLAVELVAGDRAPQRGRSSRLPGGIDDASDASGACWSRPARDLARSGS